VLLKCFPGNGITRFEQGAYCLVGGVTEGFCVGAAFSERSSRAEGQRAQTIRMHAMSTTVALPTDTRLQESRR